jgi:lauroyl/myristoyl acyltransferase
MTKKTKKAGVWGKDLNGLFSVINFVHKYRIYRLFSHCPARCISIFGKLFGFIFNRKSKVVKKKMLEAIDIMYPSLSTQRRYRIYKACMMYTGELIFDIMLYLPNLKPSKYSKYIEIENIEYLDNALALGKGVILPSIHINNFFYIIAALTSHPKRYPIAVVANMQNTLLFQNLANPREYPNFALIGSNNFNQIGSKLEAIARKNFCILLMQDMGRAHQLRTPFWIDKHPFLFHTPQSGIKLHRDIGSPILPVVAIPSKKSGKQIIRFLDPTKIAAIDDLNIEKHSKEYHGRISIEINRLFAPYLMGFIHRWEEILNFSDGRAGDELKFPANLTLSLFIQGIEGKCLEIFTNSYEPNRDDEYYSSQIKVIFLDIQNNLQNPNQIVRSNKIKIKLTGLSRNDEIKRLLKITSQILTELNEISSIPAILWAITE